MEVSAVKPKNRGRAGLAEAELSGGAKDHRISSTASFNPFSPASNGNRNFWMK